MRVRVPPAAPINKERAETLAYIVGVALGDGNLSNPNGRALRLRITCATKYVQVAEEIESALRILFPENKISRIEREVGVQCFDISVYSNKLSEWMPWRTGKGSKMKQRVRVPEWIQSNPIYTRLCLKGLIQTDGCIYTDRGYRMVNFTNNNAALAKDVHRMFLDIGYKASLMIVKIPTGHKYTTRVAKNATKLIEELGLYKA